MLKVSHVICVGMIFMSIYTGVIGNDSGLYANELLNKCSGFEDMKNALMPILENKGIPEAACIDTSTIMRIVLVDDHGNLISNDTVSIVEDWKGKTISEVVLVGILKSFKEYCGTRKYTGPDVRGYKLNKHLKIYEARTGKLLHQKLFEAGGPFLLKEQYNIIERTSYVDNSKISEYILSLKLGPVPHTPTVPDSRIITDADGNVYTTIILGDQEWTVENWRSTKFNDGTEIPYVKDSTAWSALTTPAYCWPYAREFTTETGGAKDAEIIFPGEKEKWGALYNWYVVNTGKLAPEGWRVPTDADWATLENYLISNRYNCDGTTHGNKIGKALASDGNEWSDSDKKGSVGNDQSSNNRSGFSGLPSGYRKTYFYIAGFGGYWWSAMEKSLNRRMRKRASASNPCFRAIYYNHEALYKHSMDKRTGLSVRLVKDREP